MDTTKDLCNLCGQSSYRVFESGKGIFKIVKCNYCGLLYVTPLPSDEFIRAYYNADYYLTLKENSPQMHKVWQRRLETIEGFQKKGRLLDIGCGVGDFLAQAKNKGWEVYGLEISKELCNEIEKRLDLEIFNGKLKDANYPAGYFDVITFWHVLDHMDDPSGDLRIASRLLKKGGLLVLATTNVDTYIYKISHFIYKMKNKPFFLFEKEGKELHFYHFTPITIAKMLNKAGFNVFLLKPDISGTTFLRRIIDKAANSILFPFRMNISLCMQVYARRTC